MSGTTAAVALLFYTICDPGDGVQYKHTREKENERAIALMGLFHIFILLNVQHKREREKRSAQETRCLYLIFSCYWITDVFFKLRFLFFFIYTGISI